jgi:hypothetical protein
MNRYDQAWTAIIEEIVTLSNSYTDQELEKQSLLMLEAIYREVDFKNREESK